MKNKNIWKEIEKPLGYFKDDRGEIVDVFYKKDINHVAVIKSEPNTLRGNHYHKKSIQHKRFRVYVTWTWWFSRSY